MATRARKTKPDLKAKARALLATQVPNGWPGTPQEWRQKKRGEWALVMRALDTFGWGAAYVPCGDDLFQLNRAAARITEALDEEWVLR
jgi:hypothetical protein